MQDQRAYAGTLRALGQLLDAHAARRVEIEEDERAVQVAWGAADGIEERAQFPWSDLDARRQSAEAQRTSTRGGRGAAMPVRGPWSELLRTLGQDLDAQQATRSTITGDLDLISASWVTGGRYATRQYPTSEL